MQDPIQKGEGVHARGTVTRGADGRWEAHLEVKDPARGFRQERGPEFFATEAKARDWILLQAGHHGFADEDFDIEIARE
ncbi:MAG: hypothetical protein EKK40_12280 [Bradyrhizobiaceae bacterium]|nr:MAG: hypothetical protein EKK40_12280 [Bradyrhizobiaceae bacterium]